MPTAPELDTVIACLALTLGRSFFLGTKGDLLQYLRYRTSLENVITKSQKIIYIWKKELLHVVFADEAFNDSKNRSD